MKKYGENKKKTLLNINCNRKGQRKWISTLENDSNRSAMILQKKKKQKTKILNIFFLCFELNVIVFEWSELLMNSMINSFDVNSETIVSIIHIIIIYNPKIDFCSKMRLLAIHNIHSIHDIQDKMNEKKLCVCCFSLFQLKISFKGDIAIHNSYQHTIGVSLHRSIDHIVWRLNDI